MKKELKDYLHLYLGCSCVTPYGILKLNDVALWVRYAAWFTNEVKENKEILSNHEINGKGFLLSEIKPILRPLSDMKEDEAKEHLNFNLMPTKGNISDVYLVAVEQTKYLLSKHFDLFGLIESGLAIDKTTLNSFDNK